MRRVNHFIRFAADSGDTIQDDVQLLSIGYVLIIFYVAMMLGKFTRLNVKVGNMPT